MALGRGGDDMYTLMEYKNCTKNINQYLYILIFLTRTVPFPKRVSVFKQKTMWTTRCTALPPAGRMNKVGPRNRVVPGNEVGPESRVRPGNTMRPASHR